MIFNKVSFYLLCLTIAIMSCQKDEDTITSIVIRDREAQQTADMDSLNAYLDAHYYNKAALDALGINASLTDIDIISLEAGATLPTGYTLLRTAVGEAKKTTYLDVDYEYYVLKINQGGGNDVPMFSDKIRFNYEGFTLDNAVFDFSVFPVVSDLIGDGGINSFGLIPGWSRVIPDFNTAESFIENGDGTVSFFNKGVGMMFLPSGLAYFSSFQTGIPSYSPIIFKFELLQMSENDHDLDGIPSYLEDLDGNGELLDNTDGDSTSDNFGNIFPIYDYLDTDDDGDGILTADEIVITSITKPSFAEVKSTPLAYNQVLLNKINKELNGSYTGTIITFTDTDGVKPFDYLDKNN